MSDENEPADMYSDDPAPPDDDDPTADDSDATEPVEDDSGTDDDGGDVADMYADDSGAGDTGTEGGDGGASSNMGPRERELLGIYDDGPESSPPGEGGANLDAPVGEADSEPETVGGRFYVKYTTDSSVTLHEVDTGQICTLVENPDVDTHDIIDATLVAQPPMEVSYLVDELHDRYSIPVETSPEPPTRQVREMGAEMDEMEAVAIEREGEGEIHILGVEPGNVEQTVEELHEDEMTYKNAARYGVDRVEIRADEEAGIVSVRYLP